MASEEPHRRLVFGLHTCTHKQIFMYVYTPPHTHTHTSQGKLPWLDSVPSLVFYPQGYLQHSGAACGRWSTLLYICQLPKQLCTGLPAFGTYYDPPKKHHTQGCCWSTKISCQLLAGASLMEAGFILQPNSRASLPKLKHVS